MSIALEAVSRSSEIEEPAKGMDLAAFHFLSSRFSFRDLIAISALRIFSSAESASPSLIEATACFMDVFSVLASDIAA